MKLDLSPQAHRDLNSLKRDKKLYSRVCAIIDEIANNPYSGKKLSGQLSGMFSFRVQNLRILYEIYKKELCILVIRIAPRGEVYRK